MVGEAGDHQSLEIFPEPGLKASMAALRVVTQEGTGQGKGI